jgi:hypothetical protein
MLCNNSEHLYLLFAFVQYIFRDINGSGELTSHACSIYRKPGSVLSQDTHIDLMSHDGRPYFVYWRPVDLFSVRSFKQAY